VRTVNAGLLIFSLALSGLPRRGLATAEDHERFMAEQATLAAEGRYCTELLASRLWPPPRSATRPVIMRIVSG
jgi:hypothetical protein